jgi:hypothetical protein
MLLETWCVNPAGRLAHFAMGTSQTPYRRPLVLLLFSFCQPWFARLCHLASLARACSSSAMTAARCSITLGSASTWVAKMAWVPSSGRPSGSGAGGAGDCPGHAKSVGKLDYDTDMFKAPLHQRLHIHLACLATPAGICYQPNLYTD